MTQRARQRRSAPSRKPLWIGLGALALLLLGVLAFSLTRSSSDTITTANAKEETFPNEGRDHVSNTERVTYQTNPPTSGKHWANTAQWGLYRDNPPPDEQLVHNLEHGGVIVWFNPSQTSDDEYKQLLTIYQSLSKEQYRTILTSRANMEHKIAMTAWGARLTLDAVDEKAIRAFFEKYILMGPECVDRRCPS